MIPHGALIYEEFNKLDYSKVKAKQHYCVYSKRHPNNSDPGKIRKFTPWKMLPSRWFDGTYGYLFDNYFHALAYSLKVKDEARRLKNHSQPANAQPR